MVKTAATIAVRDARMVWSQPHAPGSLDCELTSRYHDTSISSRLCRHERKDGMSYRYKPWKGSAFETGPLFNLRILILAQSHYQCNIPDDANMTIAVIRNAADGMYAGSRFFDSIQRAFVGDDMPPGGAGNFLEWSSLQQLHPASNEDSNEPAQPGDVG